MTNQQNNTSADYMNRFELIEVLRAMKSPREVRGALIALRMQKRIHEDTFTTLYAAAVIARCDEAFESSEYLAL